MHNVLIELFSGQPDDALGRWELQHVGMTIPISAEFVAVRVTGLNGCYVKVARGQVMRETRRWVCREVAQRAVRKRGER